MAEFVTYIVNLVSDLWYTWIFIMMVIESSFIPFPSEIAMIPAWYLASIWKMDFLYALIAWTSWALVWASINYILWRYLWHKMVKSLIHKYWKYVLLNENHYLKSEKYFEKHWTITIFLWRFIPAVRQLISIPAWIFKMNFNEFIIYTWFWVIIWNLILMYIGYIAWENTELIKRYTKEVLIIILAIILIILIIYYFFNKKKNNDKK